MLNHRLTEATIGHAKVIVDIIPKGKVIPNTKITPTSITIHNTGNIDASAQANHNYMKNINKSGERIASWHVTVGYDKIIQAQSFNYKTYHAGNATGNNTSIGIEICMYNDKEKQRKCYENAIALVQILLKNYGWGIDKVKQHYDWSKKICPIWLRSGKFGFTWNWFKESILKDHVVEETVAKEDIKKTNYIVRIITDSLNVRKGPSTKNDIVNTVKKGQAFTIVEEQNGWGKLKSGLGWINLSDKYVKKL